LSKTDGARRRLRSRAGAGDEMDRHARHLRASLISLAVSGVLVIGLLFAVPGLHSVGDRLADARPGWVALAVGLEFLSCLSYVLLFAGVFDRGPRKLVRRLAWSELAVNSLVSAGGTGGLALGAWVLRSQGVRAERIAERSIVLFLLTSAVNVGAAIACGLAMWIGLLPGTRDPLLTLLPAGLGVAAVIGVLLAGRGAAGLARRRSERGAKIAGALGAIAQGVSSTVAELRHPTWRLWGAVGYWAFDNLVLWVAFAAFGHLPQLPVVMMAYLVGMMANVIPTPSGIGAVEGGLVGMLVAFGIQASPAAAAVLLYRAVSLWVPGALGTLAFLRLRRRLAEGPVAPVAAGAVGDG
jgi:uncharacterized membrane protein YbhN (UPF0104 family)